MLFKITSRKGILHYSIHKHQKTAVIISITDIASPTQRIIKNFAKNGIRDVLLLKFNDVSLHSPNCISQEDATAIVDFVRANLDVDLIIFHCEMGISRSAGCCAAVMRYFGDDYESIFCSDTYRPNIGCFERVCEAFGKPIAKDKLQSLKKKNRNIWKNKTKLEKLGSLIRLLFSVNTDQIYRQVVIRRCEKHA